MKNEKIESTKKILKEGHTHIGDGDVKNPDYDPIFCRDCGDRLGWIDTAEGGEGVANFVCDECAKAYRDQSTGEYGVFVYTENDEATSQEYFDNEEDAVDFAKSLELDTGDYVEVWEKDEDGLWGNSGSPIYKSDAIQESLKENFSADEFYSNMLK